VELCDEDADSDTVCDPTNAELAMISDQEVERIEAAVLSLFADDKLAQIIIEGDMKGLLPEELCEKTGLNKTAFASKRRLIRRRIERAFPEGWKL
jgi:RNA polymerase sigma-70 factor (ECF subfamily)